MYGNSHGLSYMLDPWFIDVVMPRDHRLQLDDILFKFPVDDEPHEVIDYEGAQPIGMQCSKFLIEAEQEKEMDSFHFKILSSGTKTV